MSKWTRGDPFCLNCGKLCPCGCSFPLTEKEDWYKTEGARYHRKNPSFLERRVAEAEKELAWAKANLRTAEGNLEEETVIVGGRKIRFLPEENDL